MIPCLAPNPNTPRPTPQLWSLWLRPASGKLNSWPLPARSHTLAICYLCNLWFVCFVICNLKSAICISRVRYCLLNVIHFTTIYQNYGFSLVSKRDINIIQCNVQVLQIASRNIYTRPRHTHSCTFLETLSARGALCKSLVGQQDYLLWIKSFLHGDKPNDWPGDHRAAMFLTCE